MSLGGTGGYREKTRVLLYPGKVRDYFNVPVPRVLEVRIVLESRVAEHHRGLGTAAHRESVSNNSPLGKDRQLWTRGKQVS